MKYFFLILVLIISMGCQKRATMHTVEWEAGAGAAPTIPKDLKTQVVSVSTKYESIERFVQKWGDAEVEDSFLQVVKDKKREPVFLKMKYADKATVDDLNRIEELEKNKEVFLARARTRYPDIKSASYVSPIKIIVSSQSQWPKFYYQFDLIPADSTGVYRWKITSSYRVLEKTQVSSYYDGQGMAYPNGPTTSQIEEVLLPNLRDDGTLNSTHVGVITQSGNPAVAVQQVFFYKPEDPRFDQVQVYYYANKMIQQFKERLGVELPFKIEYKTHIGYPDKKTVMFYYDHRIHLGQGDGVNYREILKDPSIVMHETAHAFVDALAGLPQGALNEAFADFFTTSFLNNPNLGEASYVAAPFTRTVDNQMTFKDKKGTVYGDSQIISGMFWEIRKYIGTEKAESLALKTLTRLGPAGDFDSVGKIVLTVAHTDLTEADKAKVIRVLERRQMPLEESESTEQDGALPI